jgi:predicted  nucleic acid-binding Zn-ribbon protein
MLFGKKEKKKCANCGSKIEDRFSYCPDCGDSVFDSESEQEDFGLLGKDDYIEQQIDPYGPQTFGITDKIIGSMFNSLMKNLDKQFKNQLREVEKDLDRTEVRSFPNGVSIKISGPLGQKKLKQNSQNPKTREIGKDQLRKMNSFPRIEAKTNVKRVGDKVVYELSTPGVSSPEDIFISKLESGYEIKALGTKKIYVNSVPITLPLRGFSIFKNKLVVEFSGFERR